MIPFGKFKSRASAVFLAVCVAFPASSDTLTDALIGAFNHSGLLDQNRALLRAADEDVAVAMSALRPILNWSGSVQRSFGTTQSSSTLGRTVGSATNTASVSLSAELMLFDYGKSKYAIEAAKENVLATRSRLVSVEQNVLLRAINAFMSVRRESETVALRRNNLRVLTQELRAAEDRFELGEGTRTDVAFAEARLGASRAALAAAEGGLIRAQEEYRAAVGHKPGRLVPPRKLPRFASSVEEGKRIAVRNHPEMKAAQHDASAADLNVLRAEAAMKPSVKLSGGLSVTENFNSSNFQRGGSVSLGASGPIYQGGRLSALARQAMARRDAARSGLHIARHEVAQNVGNSYASFRVARASREAVERQVRAARVAFRGMREEASVGSRTTLDVLRTEQELLDAQASLISAQTDEFVAAYAVLASMGALTAKNLKLPVQHYDPAAYYNMVKTAPAKSVQGDKLDRVLRSLGKK